MIALKENFIKIHCPFCSEVMDSSIELDAYAYASGCPTCGDAEGNITIDIYCQHCKKLVYRKETEI